jgi:hypothetical protein
MALTPTYVRQQSIPATSGQQMAPLSLAADNTGQAISQGVAELGQTLQAAGERIQRREDIIAKAKGTKNYEQQELQEFTAFLDTADLTDISSVDKYVAESAQRAQDAIANFQGSDNARAEFEANIISRQGAYQTEIAKQAITTQRKFVTGEIQNEIAPIVADLSKNPAGLPAAFGKVDAIIAKYADGVDGVTEETARDMAYASVMEQTASGLLMRGKWQEANSLIQDNPLLSKYMTPSKRNQLELQIASFANDENKLRREMQMRSSVISELRAQGFVIDEGKALNYVVGEDIAPGKSFAQQTDDKLVGLGINPADATPSVRAAVNGIKLPSTTEIDVNKDYYIAPNGKQTLTVQGASKKTKPFIEDAVAMRGKMETVESQYAQWKDDKNELAGLGVLNTYLKMIDEGAVVRDSDIAMAERASPFYEQIQKAVASFAQGKAVSNTVIEQARQASQSFGVKALEFSKSYIDSYVKETKYTRFDLGIPDEPYDRLFKDIRTSPAFKPTPVSEVENEEAAPPPPFAFGLKPSDDVIYDVGADMSVKPLNSGTGN